MLIFYPNNLYFFFNRRRRIRVRPALDTRLPLSMGWGAEVLESPANDLTAHGVGFVTNRAKAGQFQGVDVVELSFSIPKSSEAIATRAKVIHVSELAKGLLVGLEFDPVDPDAFEPARLTLDAYVLAREKDMARWDSAF